MAREHLHRLTQITSNGTRLFERFPRRGIRFAWRGVRFAWSGIRFPRWGIRFAWCVNQHSSSGRCLLLAAGVVPFALKSTLVQPTSRGGLLSRVGQRGLTFSNTKSMWV